VRGLNRNVLVLGFVSFFTDLSTEMIVPLLPVFLTDELGANLAVVGLIEGISDGAIQVFKVASGFLSDRLHKRKALVFAGYTLSALTKPLLAVAGSTGQVLALRLTDRIGKGLRDAPRDALLGDSTNERQRGLAYGFHRSLDTAGAVVGSVITIVLVSIVGLATRDVFVVAGVGGLFSVVLILLFVHEPRVTKRREVNFHPVRHLSHSFWWLAMAVFTFSLGQFGSAFLILRARDAELSLGLLPLIFIVFNVTHALFSTEAGILSDKVGRKIPLSVGWILFALVSGILALGGGLPSVWVAVVGYGLFLALSDGTVRAYIADLVEPAHRATAFGIVGLLSGCALLAANFLVGVLLDRGQQAVAFGYPVVTSLLAVGLLVFCFDTRRARSKNRPVN
jgi:MFS family permease